MVRKKYGRLQFAEREMCVNILTRGHDSGESPSCLRSSWYYILFNYKHPACLLITICHQQCPQYKHNTSVYIDLVIVVFFVSVMTKYRIDFRFSWEVESIRDSLHCRSSSMFDKYRSWRLAVSASIRLFWSNLLASVNRFTTVYFPHHTFTTISAPSVLFLHCSFNYVLNFSCGYLKICPTSLSIKD